MNSFPAKILLATDGSEDAAVATRAAVDLANGGGSELHVMHAFEFIPPREYMSVALRTKNSSYFADRGQRLLDEQVGSIEEIGGKVVGAHLRRGSPVDGILGACEEIGAGLVIVGRRGLGGVRRLLMGSVSEAVVHNAVCPVLVMGGQDEAWPPTHVIMADDSSEDAAKAAALAASIGGLFGATGSLVQVYPRVLKSSLGNGALESRMVEQALRGAEEELRGRAENLEDSMGSRPDVRLLVDEGADGIDGIALTLMDEAREAGGPTLISVGSRGLGRLQRARVGSVSTKVVRAAEGPVLFHPRLPERPATSAQVQWRRGEEKTSFWGKILDVKHHSEREERVLDYIVHRIGDGANLREVTQEEYVRRMASPAEVEDILQNPRLVEGARQGMQRDFREREENLHPARNLGRTSRRRPGAASGDGAR